MSAPDPAVYRRAADVIRTGGLHKGSYEDLDGGHCTVGAVMVAALGRVDYHAWEAHRAAPWVEGLSELLGGDRGDSWPTVTTWNDRLETTEQDVITLLEQAAEKLEAEL